MYAKLQHFIQLSITLTKLCPIKCDRQVNVYISTHASAGELHSKFVAIRYFTNNVDSNLVNTVNKLLQ